MVLTKSQESEIKKLFKEKKWVFYDKNINGKSIRIKMYPGKECYVQIFTINGIHQTLPNYAGKRATSVSMIKRLNEEL